MTEKTDYILIINLGAESTGVLPNGWSDKDESGKEYNLSSQEVKTEGWQMVRES